jgi:hypothetical protein
MTDYDYYTMSDDIQTGKLSTEEVVPYLLKHGGIPSLVHAEEKILDEAGGILAQEGPLLDAWEAVFDYACQHSIELADGYIPTP